MVEALAMWLCALISTISTTRCALWQPKKRESFLPVEASPLVVAFVIWVKSLGPFFHATRFFKRPKSSGPVHLATRGHQFASTEAKMLHLRFARHLLNKPDSDHYSRNHVNFNFSRSSESWGYHAVSSVSAPLVRSLLELHYLRLGTSATIAPAAGWDGMGLTDLVFRATEVDSLLIDVLPLVSFPICQGAEPSRCVCEVLMFVFAIDGSVSWELWWNMTTSGDLNESGGRSICILDCENRLVYSAIEGVKSVIKNDIIVNGLTLWIEHLRFLSSWTVARFAQRWPHWHSSILDMTWIKDITEVFSSDSSGIHGACPLLFGSFLPVLWLTCYTYLVSTAIDPPKSVSTRKG